MVYLWGMSKLLFSITNDDFDVIDSGVFMSFPEKSIQFKSDFIHVSFEFVKTINKKIGFSSVISSGKAEFKIHNIEPRSTIAVDSPEWIGHLISEDGQRSDLYLTFGVTFVEGRNGYLVDYTFYSKSTK